jgi:hypothetical protein
VAEARALSQRAAEGLFFVAAVGQFKRGKSTLLNALLEEQVLPTGVVPATALVTLVRYGAARSARARMLDGRLLPLAIAELADYVTEERNPGNRRGVALVEVTLPSAILRGGLCLVDTPGLGSVFASNAEATRAFVPQIDAALVVLGADPPISGEELDLAEAMGKQSAHQLFVLNKADRVPAEQCREAADFAQRQLAGRLSRPVGPLLQVSATEGLAGSPTRDWQQVRRSLEVLAASSGAKLVETAKRRGLGRLALQLQRELVERRDALVRPLAESAARLVSLRETEAAALRAISDLGPLLDAEQRRLARGCEERLRLFLQGSSALTVEALRDLPDERSQAMDHVGRFVRERIESWQREQEPLAEQLYSEASVRFVALANDFLSRASGAVLPPLVREGALRAPARAWFTELLWTTGRSPPRAALDLLRGKQGVRADAAEHVARLLEVNAHRVAYDLIDRLAQSRGLLEAEVRARLLDVSASAQRAFDRAGRAHASGEGAIATELVQLDVALGELTDLLAASGDEAAMLKQV